jgi:hypothetical protein
MPLTIFAVSKSVLTMPKRNKAPIKLHFVRAKWAQIMLSFLLIDQ